MRDIKFRGKNEYGDWEYGSLLRDEPQDRYYIMNNETGCGREVDTETIGQYTGLKDKNGKEIYEGDIVEFDYTFFYGNFDTKTVICRVDFEIDGVFLNILYINDEKVSEENPQCFMLSELTHNDTEVIGNIYDNPELLGE